MKDIGYYALILIVPLGAILLVLIAVLSSHPGASISFKVEASKFLNTFIKGGDPFVLMEHGNLAGLEKLLKRHPEMSRERESARGCTPLHLAPDVDFARLLLDHGAEIDAVLKFDEITPLHEAISHGRTKVALFLIDRGASISKFDSFNRSPLHAAALYGNVEVTDALLKKGANPNVCGSKTNDLTPPLEACAQGTLNVVRYYYEHGIPFDLTDALFVSLYSPHFTSSGTDILRTIDVERFLLDTGKVDVNAQTHRPYKNGETLLHAAARSYNLEFFRILLERGADPDKPDADGKRVIDRINSDEYDYFGHRQEERELIVKILNEFKRDKPSVPSAPKKDN
ncbi:MAG TPA: ankyrin repeat domain-containing protein [Candidatus Ozemobacteraceae bacterium]|nr:ankyrin repeat domain-containing protein [Candidatus Ozemobacteraceae bacterium]